MSGFWSIKDVSDWKSLWLDSASATISGMVPSRELPDGSKQVLDSITAVLIWTLPVIEIDEITEENVKETFIRVRMLEIASGPILTQEDGEHGEPCPTRYIRFKELRRRIGMRVGAGMKIGGSLDELLLEHLRRQAREALAES